MVSVSSICKGHCADTGTMDLRIIGTYLMVINSGCEHTMTGPDFHAVGLIRCGNFPGRVWATFDRG